jgi:hypothetical protein
MVVKYKALEQQKWELLMRRLVGSRLAFFKITASTADR